MESVLGRYKNLIWLVAVLFLQVLGLAVQVKRSTDTENTRLIRVWAVDVISPFERILIWAQHGTDNLWHDYVYLRGVRAENRQLKDQIDQLRLEQVRLNEDAVQAHRLQALLAFKEQFISKTVAAQVIGSSGSDSSRMIYIDKGEDQGIKRDMAVITADGIVGKVLQTYSSVSQVLLINDQSSGVGTILEKSRLQGFLKGSATGETVLEGVMTDEQVATGEKVLTSGGDQIFPKGLPVGTVTKVATGKDLFLKITIKPAVDLSKLEEVLVVVERQQRQAGGEEVGRVRAADILAQRLPSVPDKPAEKPASVSNGIAGASGANAVAGGVPNAGTKLGAKPATAATKPDSALSPSKTAANKPAAGADTLANSPAKTASGNPTTGSKPASATSSQPKAADSLPSGKPAVTRAAPGQSTPVQSAPVQAAPMQSPPTPPDPAQDSPH